MTEAKKLRRVQTGGAGDMPRHAFRPAFAEAKPLRLRAGRPTIAQRRYLKSGLNEPLGRLPLFDQAGQRIDPLTVHACVRAGWAKPWFANALQPDWLVCTLTEAGRRVAGRRAAL
jgi:hypothetical protein